MASPQLTAAGSERRSAGELDLEAYRMPDPKERNDMCLGNPSV
jgi:hypothetical protein